MPRPWSAKPCGYLEKMAESEVEALTLMRARDRD